MRNLLIITVLLFVNKAYALQLVPKRVNNYLAMEIREINFNETFLKKSAVDGLPHRVILLGELFMNNKLISKKGAEVYFVYDLWDELFKVRVDKKNIIKKIGEFKKYIRNYMFLKLALLSTLKERPVYRFVFNVLIDPVYEKDIKRMKSYKNDQYFSKETGIQSVNIQSVSNRGASSVTSIVSKSGPRFNNVFTKILKEFSTGEQNNAFWKMRQEIVFQLHEVKK